MLSGIGLPAETIRQKWNEPRRGACRRVARGSGLSYHLSYMADEPASGLSFEDARHLVEQHAATLRPRGKELVELLEGAGQVLAEAIVADRNFPPFARALRDG